VARDSVISWLHINLLASMIFRMKSSGIVSESDLKNLPPKEVKNLGAADPR
jgi:hypothetical protein